MKKMIRKIVAVGFCICMSLNMKAQEAKSYFVNMPDTLSTLLTSVNRADCIDFIESKMKAEVTNRFGGKSEMTDLAPDYIRVQMTPQSSWQMKLLATNDSTKVICIVSTTCAPACDSDIRFYTTNWQELSAAPFLTLPVMGDFVNAPDTTQTYEARNAYQQADMLLMKADFSTKNTDLVFTFATSDYMEKEAAKELKPFLRRPLVFVWKEGKFVTSL